MSNEKPVELTEAEQRALFTAFTEDSITALRDVIETAKADAWAAARREALLEAATAAEEQWRFWWGGDASWMTTATHVTGLMADALRNRAATERGEEQA